MRRLKTAAVLTAAFMLAGLVAAPQAAARPAIRTPRTPKAAVPAVRPVAPRPVRTPVPAQPAAAPRPARTPATPKPKPTTSIELCCAWDTSIRDGISFSISAPSEARPIMSSGVRAWSGAVGIRLVEVPVGSPADVRLSFKPVSGNTQGQATVRRDGSGFITGVEIFVAGSYKGKANSAAVLEQITKHEFGHALGLKHANGNGDLMSTTIQGGAGTISACDVRAVRTAQAWHLVDGASQPAKPPVSRVVC